MKRLIVSVALGCVLAFTVSADEVLFKSGDRLQGTVVKVAGGKMVFASKVAGKVTLNMADIKTFSTDAPITIVLTDGTVVEQQVSVAAAEGQITVAPDTATPQAVAFDAIGTVNPDKVKWTGIVAVGMNFTRGNTKSDTLNVAGDAVRRTVNDRSTAALGYIFTKQRDNNTRDTTTTADKWFVRGQYDYFFSPKFYGYSNLRVEKDRIADLDLRVTPGIGGGYQWIERPDFKFFTEAGLSYVYEKYNNPSVTEKHVAARFAYKAEKTLSDTVLAYHSLEFIPSVEDLDFFLANVDFGLRMALTGRLSLDAKALLAYNSEPAAGRDKKDWQYILGVGWTF